MLGTILFVCHAGRLLGRRHIELAKVGLHCVYGTVPNNALGCTLNALDVLIGAVYKLVVCEVPVILWG